MHPEETAPRNYVTYLVEARCGMPAPNLVEIFESGLVFSTLRATLLIGLNELLCKLYFRYRF